MLIYSNFFWSFLLLMQLGPNTQYFYIFKLVSSNDYIGDCEIKSAIKALVKEKSTCICLNILYVIKS